MLARRFVLTTLCALSACLAMLLVSGGVALAGVAHLPVGSFGVNGPGIAKFAEAQTLAVEESTGDVYVYDGGVETIYKYSASGQPVEFSALKSNAIKKAGGCCGVTQIAVDSSNGPAKGDIYLANVFSGVSVYGASGQYLGELASEGHPTNGFTCGVAVDSSGNLYVGTYGYVNKYTPTANPVASSDYVATLYANNESCFVAADPSGNVYTLPFFGGAVKKHLASEFNVLGVQGLGIAMDGEGETISADRVNGDLYVDNGTQVAQYDPTGKQLGVTEGIGSYSHGVAVNGATGELYVSNYMTQRVDIFGPPVITPDVALEEPSELQPTTVTLNGTVDPSGVQVTSCQFEYGTTAGYGQVAPCEQQPGSGESPVPVTAKLTGLNESTTYHYRLKAANDKIAVTSKDRTFTTYGPPTIKALSVSGVTRTTGTLHADVNPRSYDTTYRFEYGTDTKYGTSVPVPDRDIGSGTGDVEVSAELLGLEQGTTYHYRLVAVNSHGETDEEDQTFNTEPAVRIGKTWVTQVKIETAKLHAEISPRGLDTTYAFEYGTDTKYGSSVPVPAGTIGEKYGEEAATVSESLYALTPGTTYHFRVVATNANGTDAGPDQTFTTFGVPSPERVTCPNAGYRTGASIGLPDCRAYEMVSPADKNGADIQAGQWKPIMASKSGDRVVFGTSTGLGDTHGSGGVGYTDFLAERHAGGWSVKGITPTPARNDQLQLGEGETNLEDFSEELDRASLVGYDLPGTSGGMPEEENVYAENLNTNQLEVVSRFENPGEAVGGYHSNIEEVLYGSGDLSVIPFQTPANLLPQAHGSNQKLYEFDHGTLKLAGVLPDGSVPAGGAKGARRKLTGLTRVPSRDMVSRDGSRIFFVSPIDGSAPEQLYMRRNASETVWVSQPEVPGESFQPLGVKFQGATPDGKKVLFTTPQQLVDSDPGGAGVGLYMYTDSPNPETESNLMFMARISISGEREAVKGISEDGSHVYFASGATSTVPLKVGETGLFLWDQGTIKQVAPVAGPARAERFDASSAQEARLADHGKRIVFTNDEPLGVREFGELPLTEGVRHTEVFLYDEETETLKCISCPPNGETPISGVDLTVNASSIVPAFYVPIQPNFVTSDGKYIFFNTVEGLVPQDTNGVEDAYEYNVETGKLSLLSPGTGEEGTWFVEASPDGHDVFLATRQQLTGWDEDKLVDIYDARVDGGFPEPPKPPVPCQGEECQGIPAGAPDFSTASGFAGLGNLKPAATAKATPKSASRSGKLQAALHACKHKRRKRSRARCEANARRRFAVKSSVKHKSRRSGR